MVKLRIVSKRELHEGMVIYFEYEHNYNPRSRAMRYKRGYFLGDIHGKALLILQSLHGSWNKSTTICNYDRIHIESYIGLAEAEHSSKSNNTSGVEK